MLPTPRPEAEIVSVGGVLSGVLRAYKRFVSPLLPPACRFWPTCSEYALDAIELHGAFRGSWLALRRVARCHPFSCGGVDPVPGPGAPARPTSR